MAGGRGSKEYDAIGMGEFRLSNFEGETRGWSLWWRMHGLNSFYSLSSFLWEEKTRGLMQCG